MSVSECVEVSEGFITQVNTAVKVYFSFLSSIAGVFIWLIIHIVIVYQSFVDVLTLTLLSHHFFICTDAEF